MRTANSAAARSSERPRQPSHSAMMVRRPMRGVDRDGGDEQRVEGEPRHVAARARRGSRAAESPPRTAKTIVARCTTTQSASTMADARCASHSRASPADAGTPASRAARRRRAHSSPRSAARAVARFRPAIEAVGLSAFGQSVRQLSWLWQAWQPASPATARRRSGWPSSRTSLTSVQARLSAAGPR